MSVLVCLLIILLILMRIIGGDKGFKSFFSLFLNIGVIFISVILMSFNLSPILVTLCASLLISSVNLFYINDINQKTLVAFIATFVTLILIVAFIFIIVKKTMIQGLGEEEIVEMDMYSLHLGIDFITITICTIIMGSIGAMNDTAISISSTMNELRYRNPEMSQGQLFRSGMNVGRDVLGTTTNTLFFAFIGGSLALMVWLKDLNYSLVETLNSKVFNGEVLAILLSGIGVTLIIPVTAWLMLKITLKEKISDQAPENE